MTRALLALLLIAAALTAGCTKDDGGDGGGDGGNATPPTGTTPVTTTPGNGTGGGGGGAAPPQMTPVTDQGDVQGPFSKSWTITVPQVSPRAVTVQFNLTGAQAGVPPTARVHLEFVSPDGTILKSTGVGLGESGNSVAWTFGPADLPATGDYTLRAAANPAPAGPGVPSGGVAKYQLYALVEY